MLWARYSSGSSGSAPSSFSASSFYVGFLECVGDVLEEDQAEYDVFVFGGVHAPAEGVGHLPQTQTCNPWLGCRLTRVLELRFRVVVI